MIYLKYDISQISDIQAEAGVIATILQHPEYVLQIEYLKPGYFYDVANGCFYWAIEELYKNGVDTIDALNISNMLNSNNAVKKKMKEHNLMDIREFVEMSQYAARHSIEEYRLLVENVVVMAFKRDLFKYATNLQSACFDVNNGLDELNTFVNEGTNSITQKYVIGSDSVLFGDKVDSLWQSILSKRNDDGSYGIPSKIPRFNEYFTFAKGEMILIKARMKRGKSGYFMNEAIHKIQNGIGVLYIDTEMSDEAFLKRMIANISGVEIKCIENGHYSQEEAKKIQEAITFLKQAPFVHEFLPEFNENQIMALCKRWMYKFDLQMLVYDYMKCDETKSAAEVSNILGHQCNFLKNQIAGKLDISVLAGAQLNRGDEVASSDQIERYVSTSIWWREKTLEEIQDDGLACGNFCAKIDLNRNGAQMMEGDYVDIMFDGPRMRIVEAQRHKTEETPFG